MFLDAVRLGCRIGIVTISAGTVVVGFSMFMLFLFATLSPKSTKK